MILKPLSFTVVITLFFICASCGGRERHPADSADDSASMADLAQMEAEARQKAALQAQHDSMTLDSLRRDSILHSTPFSIAIPKPATLFAKTHKERAKYLENLGFKGSAEFESGTAKDDACSAGSYRLAGEGGESCRVSWADLNNEVDIKVTITGDAKTLNRFYKEALRLESANKLDIPMNVALNGNTVSIVRRYNPADELPAQ